MTRFIPASKWKKSTKRVCKTLQIVKAKKAKTKVRYGKK